MIDRRPASTPRLVASKRGQVIVIVALAMVALMAMAGLVLDGGIAVANRRQAQNVADAAAMGGARVIGIDRYEKVHTPPPAPQTWADPGAAVQQAILDALVYNANSGQTFDAVTWGAPGSPEYTDFKGNRFPSPDFPGIGPLYVQPGPIPGQAQGVYVPVSASNQTVVMQVVGISQIGNALDATAVAGPSSGLGKLLPLVIRDRYTECANSSSNGGNPCDPAAVRAPLDAAPPPYQHPYTPGCQYDFRQTNPAEITCVTSTETWTDPPFNTISNPDYSGNFGWIDWDGGNSPTSELNPWISDPAGAPTDWYFDVCPDPAADDTCRIPQGTLPIPKDDLFWRLGGTTGNRNTSIALVETLYLNQEVYVPIWRATENPGTGTNATFEVIGFGTFRVDAVYTTGSNKGFRGTYLESWRGGQVEQCTIVPNTCSGSGAAPFSFSVNLAR